MKYKDLLKDKEYITILTRLKSLERDRIFCRHGMEHLLDVARIAYILNLEEGLNIDKDIIYTTALLHDIGRVEQYITGEKHHAVGARLAVGFLERLGCTPEEIALICDAIAGHGKNTGNSPLADILYKADKLSRICFACEAEGDCDWDEGKKNHTLRY